MPGRHRLGVALGLLPAQHATDDAWQCSRSRGRADSRTPAGTTAPTCARRGIRCTIPDKSDRARNHTCAEPAVRYEATDLVAAINEWL
ncbi:hypothetical protein ABT168_03675 [Streptomyces sp. NPDC001793]|uniref:hypothetical protein n=1 Tax=Streptomyces sp. NPDC001793 TaxID=3154657 RepID=UPI0033264E05